MFFGIIAKRSKHFLFRKRIFLQLHVSGEEDNVLKHKQGRQRTHIEVLSGLVLGIWLRSC